ncbi:MauE/DoxX family redox-associated membrane protein [Paracoccus aestuariivivens]|uniref:Methylamine utilization protein MauE n=1 Tax=Paracoccus aestuariivivens TaxID=1820333 RepID=A0A6L6J7V6_9RHOB|nr:MauE/DoxX family redox-associated membrane protein [Paracoccus aestuariivivens]MTH78030.1 methylamine utilization protein MauE [Paracoccus aestuariivivens]
MMHQLAPITAVALTTFVALILIRSVWHKSQAFLETVGFAQGYGLVPDGWTPAIVRTLTVTEAAIVLALLVPPLHAAAGLMAAGLFAGYGLLMAVALSRGQTEIDCGCGGAPQRISGVTLARNAVLTALALGIATMPSGGLGPVAVLTGIAAGLTFAGLQSVAEKLASHLPNIRRAS